MRPAAEVVGGLVCLRAASAGRARTGGREQVVRMNPIEKVIRRIDAFQQRHKATAFVFGLIKKYGDDNGGVLVANLAHSGSFRCSRCCWCW